MDLGKLLRNPNQVGFVQGHYYLQAEQVSQLEKCLKSGNEEIVDEFDRQMAALIGPGLGISFAAGRMAFYSLLKALDVGEGDEVILPGFTCSVMPNAVWRTGATPVFADIDQETLGSSADAINRNITRRTRAIVAQHSFGIPCNIKEIIDLGEKLGIPVVEDCAIALDSSISGIKVGNWGTAAIFSTDHSKPLNTVIGGFFYTRDLQLFKKVAESAAILPQLSQDHQYRLWEQLLFERKYSSPESFRQRELRRCIGSLLKYSGIRNNESIFLEGDSCKPEAPGARPRYPYPAKMPSFLARLGLFELSRWEQEKINRQNLLRGYLQLAVETGISRYLPRAYQDSGRDIIPLRFAFSHPGASALIGEMAKLIDISWTWFRLPVIGCEIGPENLGYKSGQCPTAEWLGAHVINWPCVVPKNWHPRLLSFFKNVTSQ
jgi:perosamine synthetase